LEIRTLKGYQNFLFSDLRKKIFQIVYENPSDNFFFDKVPIGDGITLEDLQEVSEKVSKEKYLWIACRSDFFQSAGDLKNFGNFLPTLTLPY
jgi:hypothetical protein